MSGNLETDVVSFEDIAVDFTRDEWQLLDISQRTLYKDVMLENYSSLVFLGHCMNKPELIFKLEHGFDPWNVTESSIQSLPGIHKLATKMKTIFQNDRYFWQGGMNNAKTSREEIVIGHLTVRQRPHIGEKPYNPCGNACFHKSNFTICQGNDVIDKPHECDQCGKAFAKKSYLTLHQRTHTGEKPYECELCGKAFSWKSNFNVHQRTHTGDKPYECVQCGKAFSCKSHLINHKRIHTGEKPYDCERCGKAFSNKTQLTVHQRYHIGAKPYVCEKCGKAFSRKFYLNNHQRTHMGRSPITVRRVEKPPGSLSSLSIKELIQRRS